MAKKKVTQLPQINRPLAGPEILLFVQDGVSKQGTVDDLPSTGGGSSDPNDIILDSVISEVTLSGIVVPGYDTTGKTLMQFITDLLTNYAYPSFNNSFSVTGQATTVEVGTTLTGSKTFTWSISVNDGVVSTLDIYDNTAASTLVSNTANDGTQAATIATIQLNSNGAQQSWKGIAHDTGTTPGNINSNNFIVTARFYRFFGPSATSPTNSATVRALPSSAFHTGAGSFTLATGTVQTKFVVALPPGITISSVIDQTALNADITSQYVLTGTINVVDAGGTNRSYNIYEMNQGIPYSSSHNHLITVA